MITIDLKAKLIDYSAEGKEVQLTDTQASVLAHLLKSSKTGDVMKFYDWWVALSKTGVITVDRSDFELLENFIKNNQEAWVFVRGQLLQTFSAARQQKQD